MRNNSRNFFFYLYYIIYNNYSVVKKSYHAFTRILYNDQTNKKSIYVILKIKNISFDMSYND